MSFPNPFNEEGIGGPTTNPVSVAQGGTGGTNGNLLPVTATNATASRTLSSYFSDFLSVKDFGAKGDGVTDDTIAIQAAVTFACSTEAGAGLLFPDGTYVISSAINIPFTTQFRFTGAGRGGTTISQATANTPIFTIDFSLTWGWTIEEMNFTYASAQSSSETGACCIYFNGNNSQTIFNWQIRRCTFENAFRGISSGPNAGPVWGVHISDCVFDGTLSGAAIYIMPNPSVGQPSINIENCYIMADVATEQSIQIGYVDVCTLKCVEFNNGSFANSPNGLLSIVSSGCVNLIGSKVEVYDAGSSSNTLWNFPQSNVNVLGCSFSSITGSGYPTLINVQQESGSGGNLTISGYSASFTTTGSSVAFPYSATFMLSIAGLSLAGNVSTNLRQYQGNVAMPNFVADNLSCDYSFFPGDASYSITNNLTARIISYSSTLTADRTVTLPTNNLLDGQEYIIFRTSNTAPGSFALSVSDTTSGLNYTIPANCNGWVHYRCDGGGWLILSAGVTSCATTIVSGSTSGTARFTFNAAQQSQKKVVVYCAALLGTASYTFPVAFTNTPVIVTTNGPAAGLVTSLSSSAMTITGTTTTGYIIIEGD